MHFPKWCRPEPQLPSRHSQKRHSIWENALETQWQRIAANWSYNPPQRRFNTLLNSGTYPIPKREPKTRLFVGSSTESLPYARALQKMLDPVVTVWERNVFHISEFGLDSLLEAIKVHDFGVFIFAADDVAIIRKRRQSVVRDNVLFELGLFMGRLGRERTFLIAPKDVDLHLPSDLMGWNVARYNPRRTDRTAALDIAASQIRHAMRRLGRFCQEPPVAAIQSASKIQFAPSSFPPYDPARIRKVVIELQSGPAPTPRRSRK